MITIEPMLLAANTHRSYGGTCGSDDDEKHKTPDFLSAIVLEVKDLHCIENDTE